MSKSCLTCGLSYEGDIVAHAESPEHKAVVAPLTVGGRLGSKCDTCGQPVASCLAGSALDGLELHFAVETEAGFRALLELAPDPEALAALSRVGSPRSFSAADAYAFRSTLVSQMLTAIQDGLVAHAADQSAKPGNWGFAGDLGHAGELLGQVMGALGVVEAH